MADNKPATFYVSDKFDPGMFPKELQPYVAYLLNLIHWKQCNFKTVNGWVVLNAHIMDRVFPRELRQYREQILRRLARAGVIECDRTIVFGEKSRGYRLTNEYINTSKSVCTDERLNNKIATIQEESRRQWLPTQRWCQENFESISFSLDRAKSVVPSLMPDKDSALRDDLPRYHAERLANAVRLADGNYDFSCDQYGRIHTPLTHIEKELRCCFTVNGQHLVGIDLANSQPLIAGIVACMYYSGSRFSKHRLLHRTYEFDSRIYSHSNLHAIGSFPVPKDVREYNGECSNGTFYESWMREGEDRQLFKIRFYRGVLFGRNRGEGEWQPSLLRRFLVKYPSVALMIRNMKKREYERSAWIMQNYEATIFIHLICGRIRRERPTMKVYTIHDSLLVLPQDVEYTKAVIMDEFRKLGVHPKLVEESYE